MLDITAKQPARRRLIIRGGLAILWIGLGVILFLLYRGHTVLVDNRPVETPSLRAPDLITVSIDGGAGLEFLRGDRDRFAVTGSRHRIRVESGGGAQPFEQQFTLPVKDDMYLLSIPKMLNRIEPFVEVFKIAPEPPRDAEEELPDNDETGILGEP
ncbi:MAG: hypothetical protein LBD55_03940 [Treponema sp.]|nr:hypothetical protein [Treponema sp.]